MKLEESQLLNIRRGRQITFTAGQTILEAAQANQINIPTLCHLKGAIPTGACRICVVEVKGARTLLAACSTPAAADMVVQTDSPNQILSDYKTLLLPLQLRFLLGTFML